ncbi:Diphthamide biosynthesis protein 3 [Colletotrichum orbiculare MAFF 240422]|uniref:Diphthamide biosynthesis protein 3 n=2 Tax=Colletotrichum orbiculare species complex TaxID=2707354 RepID=N4V779_COLOR|nr:Diphthamide biosynthesis protein 3 [Colletotrichum orbiculare MAFF 240422]TDZ67781.1 Diphthamide biosynthesis protein 3 [Colletotrichum trifolii]
MADDNISIYDEIEIEDMTFDEDMQIYHYPCPCGDKFQIALADLRDEEDIADDLPKDPEDEPEPTVETSAQVTVSA